MNDGMKAEPSWSLHAIRPVSLTMTLAAKPKKIPATTYKRMDKDVSRSFRKRKEGRKKEKKGRGINTPTAARTSPALL
jgi:hypothetical protein